ncbi:MAG: terminase small subunit [Magnetococcales bacterium]|nr:terminase small subunit [Magnetococcales bacterium]
MHPDTKQKLTKRQARFVEEYLTDFNATQAAVRAGYSEVNAARIGYENLQKVHIQSAIGNRQKELLVSSSVKPEQIVKELTKLAFADVSKLYDQQWNVRNLDEVPVEVRAAIVAVSKTTTPHGITTVKLTLVNKLSALDSLARLLGMHNGMWRGDESQAMSDDELRERISQVFAHASKP